MAYAKRFETDSEFGKAVGRVVREPHSLLTSDY
jgi:hypothetical protein